MRIDRETLSGWGEKSKRLKLKFLTGKGHGAKSGLWRVQKRIIQIPDKMQLSLEIMKGEPVKVKPATKS